MAEAAKKESTRLVLRQGEGENAKFFTMFLNTTKADGTPVKTPFFSTPGGAIRGFLGRNGQGELSGAVDIVVPGNKDEGIQQVTLATLFFKKGNNPDKGDYAFFSGYGSELVADGDPVVRGDKSYQNYGFNGELEKGEDGKFKNAVDITAHLDGPEAQALFDMLPGVQRPKKGPSPS